jgi:pimeloyl-ACP methyl ester carboxylesterase
MLRALLALMLSGASLVAGAITASSTSPMCSMGAGVDSAPVTPGQVPVLFVHGINSGPGMWDAYLQGQQKSLRTLASEIPGAATYAFSYQDAGLAWVTDNRIGPALATAITCLANSSQRKVVVVAHSMGGLATQFALGQTIAGTSVANRVSTVVTLGTPFQGSKFLRVAQAARAGGDTVAAAGGRRDLAIALETTLAACAKWGQQELAAGSENPCGLAAVSDSPVGTALQYGSSQIGELPTWPNDVRVIALAGDIEAPIPVADLRPPSASTPQLSLPRFNHALVPIGVCDVPVSLDSATSVGKPVEPLRCPIPLLETIFSSACWHVSLPSSPVLAGATLTAIRIAAAASTPASGAEVDWPNHTYTTDCDGDAEPPLTVTLTAGAGGVTRANGYGYGVAIQKVVTGDLTGDGRPETAVLIRCEPQPSNYYTQEIQVFTADARALGPPLRPKDLRGTAILPPLLDAGSLLISQGALQVGAGFYVEGDSHASGPSKSSVIVWRWQAGELRVVSGR